MGDTESVTSRLAPEVAATVAVALAVLVPPVVAVAEAKSLSWVPIAVPAFAVTFNANVPEYPAAKPPEDVHVMVPLNGVVQLLPLQVTPPMAGGVMETKVVFAGIFSANVTAVVVRPPMLLTTGE